MLCKATNKAGKPCKAQAMSSGYCYRHNPDIATADKLLASKRGGLKYDLKNLAETAQPIDTETYEGLLVALDNNTNDLREGKIDPRTSNALVQNILAIIEIKKIVDLNNRLTMLEQRLNKVGYNKL